MADRGGATVEEVGRIFVVMHERMCQVEAMALRRLARRVGSRPFFVNAPIDRSRRIVISVKNRGEILAGSLVDQAALALPNRTHQGPTTAPCLDD